MSIYSEANAAFAEVHSVAVLGEACSIANANTTGVFNGEQETYRFDGQSQRKITIRQAVVLKSNYANRPADRAVVVKGSSSYVITAITDDPCQWIISLEKRT